MRIPFLNNQTPSRSPFLALLTLFLAANLVCAVYVVSLASRQARLKTDYAHVNSVSNGLFSMEIWKKHFENIVSKSITNLTLTPADEKTLKSEIEKVVKVMISQADSMLSKNKTSLGSKVRKVAYKAVVDVPALMKKSPQFAQSVVDEITKPETLEQLRVLALNQLNKYAADTRNNNTEGPPLSSVLSKYNVTSVTDFNSAAELQIDSFHQRIRGFVLLMMGSVGIVLLAWWFLRQESVFHKPLYIASTCLAAIFLVASLSVPMLDIDARIKTIDLVLLGEPIQFSNQVLFYRSKSILDVVNILMVSGKGDRIFVGFLLLLFSVIFPMAKLGSTILYLSGKDHHRKNKWVTFFAFKSGKWSMADVMVVAIFMAYIGFNSILNDQLEGLNVTSDSWQMITTNGTSLQPGFMLFVTFVLFGLALSEILKRIVIADLPYTDMKDRPAYRPSRISVVS